LQGNNYLNKLKVRRFQQDDAHIFCRPDQVKSEIKGALEFLENTYGIFGFKFKLFLSTRPKNFMGEIEVWNNAEKQLTEALNDFIGNKWSIKKEDGAFYGPKIDIVLEDALKREHQCGTLQLDFQLTERFKLNFVNEEVEGERNTRPVMIHRAIYGSFERFLAILTEHYGGKWPFWISPRQISIIPISLDNISYGEKIYKIFSDEGFYVDIDTSTNQFKKKLETPK